MRNNRLVWLDIAKGISIILVILGHTSLPAKITDFIYSFHMPLFFIASGYTTIWDKYNYSVFFKKKIKSLIRPFIIYSSIILLILLYIGHIDLTTWIRQGWGGYALWFIPVLLLSLLLTKVMTSIQSKILKCSCYAFLIVLAYYLSVRQIKLPWTISSIPYATFLIILGVYFRKMNNIITQSNLYVILLSFILTLSVSLFFRLDMAYNRIIPIIPITFGALSGTLFIFTISSFISKKCPLISKIFKYIGTETYIILAFSQIIIILLNLYFTLNLIVKYALLVLLLMFLIYIKNFLVKIYKNMSI